MASCVDTTGPTTLLNVQRTLRCACASYDPQVVDAGLSPIPDSMDMEGHGSMLKKRASDTLVIQTFRRENVPMWMERCLSSVQAWAASQGHDYSFSGDEFFQLCGPQYLTRGNKNPRAITNLARLIATRQSLDAGYSKVIWLDADVFVFDPERLAFDFPHSDLATGYAFGREIWLDPVSEQDVPLNVPTPHNAAMYFTDEAVDLDMLIGLIRHIDARRELVSNFQVGVKLLKGLQYSLMFPTFPHVALYSPALVLALNLGQHEVLRKYAKAYRYRSCAANLCLSLDGDYTESGLLEAMDLLEGSKGEVINTYATHDGLPLIPFDQRS